ncbi:energy transducer TonB [Chitinophaga agrisoli]|uniref:Energy transducer TonB n=1 Tax=Chitinophaga agrisoli TaxID=2607653 RepID=A0A5B2VRZ4_9BACT|nr:energy transducer TonB [Chitinophaga agrisoli]KAA2241400.1 energy transducer TonB [Chitinophaga agrisoli]
MMTSTTNSGNDFLDILFNERNKEYGAYILRRKYDQRVRNAIIGTASVALVIVGGYALNNRLMASNNLNRPAPPPIETVKLMDPNIEQPVTPPPPPPPPAAPAPQVHTERFVVPVIARNVADEDVPPPMDELQHAAIGVTTSAGVDADEVPDFGKAGGSGVVTLTEPAKEPRPEEVFIFVEIPPTFPGGNEALAQYLRKTVRYPNLAAENGVSGRIFVQFVIDYEGNIKDVKTVGNHVGAGLEEEAMRVVKAMPKWKPGKQNGRYVSVQFNLPIVFHLDN